MSLLARNGSLLLQNFSILVNWKDIFASIYIVFWCQRWIQDLVHQSEALYTKPKSAEGFTFYCIYIWRLLHNTQLLSFMKTHDFTHHFLVSIKQFVLLNEVVLTSRFGNGIEFKTMTVNGKCTHRCPWNILEALLETVIFFSKGK